MFSWIVLDLDGTLNNDKHVITKKTRDALLYAQEQGTRIVLASGRPTSGFHKEIEALQLHTYHGIVLSYNGGKIIDVHTGNVLYENSIPLPLAKALCRHLEAFPVIPIVDDGMSIYTDNPNGFQIAYESSNNQLMIKRVDNIADALDFSPVKVLIACPQEELAPILEDIRAPFEQELSFILSAPFYFEATRKGIDKSSSLKILCELLNISSKDMIAFGNAQNDYTMLSYAGHGVAMGNACEACKQIAQEVTLTNNEDGIAHTLKKFFPIEG